MDEVKKPNQIGHVIRILDKYTLIIDAGNSKVSVGDTIQVYETGDVINDLKGEPLGYYIHIKDELEVVQTEDRYSLCKKNKTITKTLSYSLSPMLERTLTEKLPLNVYKNDIQPLNACDNIIHVGDSVKLA